MDRDSILRQRGWSIISETTQGSATEPSDLEKLELLQSMPHRLESHDEHHHQGAEAANVGAKKATDHVATEEQNIIADGKTIGHVEKVIQNKGRSEEVLSNSRKRTREDEKEADNEASKQRRIAEHAKSRLSKWASRLFDPDRPRGLIEPPQTIPLNDEFLQAFGKREKEFDEELGKQFDIEHTIEDPTEEEVENNVETYQRKKESKAADMTCKVKILNLRYTTTAASLEVACSRFGPVESVNLIMDRDSLDKANPLNIGKAYVTFENPEAAEACIQGLKELDGRPLRVTPAQPLNSARTPNTSRQAVRYWLEDISTKCYRCGQVGHKETDCSNEPQPKPCPLCGETDHDFRNCQIKSVCFNCGTPGHVSKNCSLRSGLPPRRLCTLCFRSDHHRYACRENLRSISANPACKCMVCGELGHYLCKELKWFFGVKGVTCGNCGRAGHTGSDCVFPNLETCSRNEDLTRAEIERAEDYDAADQEQLKSYRPSRTDRRERFDEDRRRARSMPPPRRRHASAGSRETRTPPAKGGGRYGQNSRR